MEIQPPQPTVRGPAEWFTGEVWMDPVVRGTGLSRVRVSAVRFTPGARTAWHSHALGQTLFVTDGAGRAQTRGEEMIELRPGQVVYTPPDEWHWHGADPDRFMCHISISEGFDDADRPDSTWGDHVTDGEYTGGI
jgi:quercetin dioxygenase-like cupin family protein